MTTPLDDSEVIRRIIGQMNASTDAELLARMAREQQNAMPSFDRGIANTALMEEVKRLTTQLHARTNELNVLRTEVSALRTFLDNEMRRPKPAPSQALILELIKLAHPDKWHGKPATELAHELTTRLNALREQA